MHCIMLSGLVCNKFETEPIEGSNCWKRTTENIPLFPFTFLSCNYFTFYGGVLVALHSNIINPPGAKKGKKKRSSEE